MRVKVIASLMLATIIVAAVVANSIPYSAAYGNGKKLESAAMVPNQNTETSATSHAADPPSTINGAATPELIPDYNAYLMLFRLIGDRREDGERQAIRAYVSQYMQLGTHNCDSCPPSGRTEADIDALIAAADEFHQRVSAFDVQAAEIKDRAWPDPSKEVMQQLTILQQQKEALVAEIIASLPRRLSSSGMVKVREHVNNRIKRKIKLTPGPATPPGGPGWQRHPPEHAMGNHH